MNIYEKELSSRDCNCEFLDVVSVAFQATLYYQRSNTVVPLAL